jgi:hypothetical protein
MLRPRVLRLPPLLLHKVFQRLLKDVHAASNSDGDCEQGLKQ